MRRTGFTLVELLVVVAVIAVLISLLAPALDKAIDAAVKAKCAAQQHALIQVFTNYAGNNHRKYPPGTRDAGPDEHVPYLGKVYVAMVETYAGNNNKGGAYFDGSYTWGGLPPLLSDPSFSPYFGLTDGYGSWIGYNYLGGHPWVGKANAGPPSPWPDWESPTSLSNTGSGDMWACHNTWSPPGYIVNVAHTREGGPLGSESKTWAYFNYGFGRSARQADSSGGNVGRVDGYVGWKDLIDMKEYMAGANSAGGGYSDWPAMW